MIIFCKKETKNPANLYLVLDWVEVFCEYVEVELSEFGFEHEEVVTDADEAQRVQRVQLDVPRVVKHEEERRLEHLVNGVAATL